LEEVDVNEKKVAGAGGSGRRRPGSPAKSSTKSKAKNTAETSDEAEGAEGAPSRKETPLYLMPMDSFYTKALVNAKICLLLLYLLQVHRMHARSFVMRVYMRMRRTHMSDSRSLRSYN
jgi:hypothetical protein